MSEESLRKDPVMEYMNILEKKASEEVTIEIIVLADGTKYRLPKPISMSHYIQRDSTQFIVKLLCELLNLEKIEE